ncbi:hypothetical protein [Rhodococcus sp. 24CO]|uniref:hypothetical protein n=1 Tax=Rhodococcus sp. 24CO TaxID=3117460 RepID=UPI003D32581E
MNTFRVIAGAAALAVLWPVVSSAEPRTDTAGVVIESHDVSRSVADPADCGAGSRPDIMAAQSQQAGLMAVLLTQAR